MVGPSTLAAASALRIPTLAVEPGPTSGNPQSGWQMLLWKSLTVQPVSFEQTWFAGQSSLVRHFTYAAHMNGVQE